MSKQNCISLLKKIVLLWLLIIIINKKIVDDIKQITKLKLVRKKDLLTKFKNQFFTIRSFLASFISLLNLKILHISKGLRFRRNAKNQ